MCQSLNCPSEGAISVHNHIVELLAVGTVGLPLPGAVGEARDLDLLAAVRTTNAEDIGVVAVLVVDTHVITEQGATLGANRISVSGQSVGSTQGSGCDDGGGEELLEHGFVVWYVKIITGLGGPVNP